MATKTTKINKTATSRKKSATSKARRKRTKEKPPPPPPPRRVDPESPKNKRDRRRANQRREDLRNELWPRSAGEFWSRKTNDGFGTIPRVLPLMTVLLRHLTKKKGDGDATSVYIDLWARVYDEGYVQITNPIDNAYSSGYSGSRAQRTWQERMRLLEDHGFIKIAANGAQEYGHVLIMNPLLLAARLRHEGKVPDEWWAAFRSRADEIGAVIPDWSEE
jgi:hypothetical protein